MMFLREYKQDTNIPNETWTQKNFLLLKKQKKKKPNKMQLTAQQKMKRTYP